MSREFGDPFHKDRLDYGFIFATNQAALEEVVGAIPFEREDKFALNAGHNMNRVVRKWRNLNEITPSWFEIRGANVLDFGSGSEHAVTRNGTVYYPHFARFAAVCGANVTAVDIFEQGKYDQTLFADSIKADLVPIVMENKLTETTGLKNKKFDIIHASSFVGWMRDPSLLISLERHGISGGEFDGRLLTQSEELLAENGIIDFNDDYIYRMKNGEIVEEKARLF